MTTTAFIMIGNELLSGRTHDKNLPVLASRLNDAGIDLKHARVIPDITETIIATVNELKQQYDYIFTSGGIGPTHDDITSAAIAKAFNVKLERNPEAVAMLQSHYTPEEFNEARQTMADIPAGAGLIENPISRAPGFVIENVYVLAGVPRIFEAMLDFVMPQLQSDNVPVQTRTISSPKTEGQIAVELGYIQAKFATVDIGSYPYFKDGNFGVSLVLRSRDAEALERCAKLVEELVNP